MLRVNDSTVKRLGRPWVWDEGQLPKHGDVRKIRLELGVQDSPIDISAYTIKWSVQLFSDPTASFVCTHDEFRSNDFFLTGSLLSHKGFY